jgi:hypothetical protein
MGITSIGAQSTVDVAAALVSQLTDVMAQLAAAPDQMASGTITRSASGAATSFAVLWPDGATGTFTGTESTSVSGAIDAYTVTKVTGSVTVTYTQPALTRDVGGNVTSRPDMTVS